MTEEDKDAVIGKAVREHAETTQLIAQLRARLAGIGDEYTKLATGIRNRPENVIPMGETYDGRFAVGPILIQVAKWVELAAILELARQLRAVILREQDLERQLTQLGVPPR